jgi:hypothetical protein
MGLPASYQSAQSVALAGTRSFRGFSYGAPATLDKRLAGFAYSITFFLRNQSISRSRISPTSWGNWSPLVCRFSRVSWLVAV